MQNFSRFTLLTFLLLTLFSISASAEDPLIRHTASGDVQGMVFESSFGDEQVRTHAWLGIPYAAPPVEKLRWKSPEPHPGWSGVLDTTQFGARCVQKDVKGALKIVTPDPSGKMSEDCLFMNIWRPAKSGEFPVMVWIHGGGYHWGTANTDFYWGDRLAAAGDVIVVSFNYRLDILGFYALPALRDEDPNSATGGQGSLDQVAALKWVNQNIENFGGDPDNVTIFGESAGGYSICTMLVTPLTKGLFQRAIMQSGGCDVARELDKGYLSASEVAKRLGCRPDDLDCLRAIPADKVLSKGAKSMMALDARPHLDDYLLSDTPVNMIASGNYNSVPLIAGYNRDEAGGLWKFMPAYSMARPSTYQRKLVKMGFSQQNAADLARLYPLEEFNNKPAHAYGRMFGADIAFGCPTYQGLLAVSAQQADVYHYRFEYDDFIFGKYAGSAHGMELPFVFNSMDRRPVNLLYHKWNMDQALDLSKIVQGYWLNFAKTGNPNGPGLPQWPEFNPDTPMVQILDVTSGTQPANDTAERFEFWKNLEDEQGSLPGLFDSFE